MPRKKKSDIETASSDVKPSKKRTYKKRTYKKKDVPVEASAKKDKEKKIDGNWAIPSISEHFDMVISAGIAEKRKLVKEKKYKENKKKKLRYILQNNGKFKKAKKNDKGKNLINVYYD